MQSGTKETSDTELSGCWTTEFRAAPDLVSIKGNNLVVPTLYAHTQARSPRHGRANGPSGSTAGDFTVLLDRRCPINFSPYLLAVMTGITRQK